MMFDGMINSRGSSGRGRGSWGWRERGSGSQRGGGLIDGGRRMMSNGRQRNPQDSLRVNARPSASTIAKPFARARNFPWKHDLFEDSIAASGLSPMDSETKLLVSNLDIGVSNVDIRDIFSSVGEMERYAIHYGNDGVPTGTAEVVFAKRSDAFYALQHYNNVKLDGRPLKIEIISPKVERPVSARVNVFRGPNGGAVRVLTMPGGGRPRPMALVNRGPPLRARGGGVMNNGRGRGWGRGRIQRQAPNLGHNRGKKPRMQWKPKEKSAVELDKELEKYRAEGMETS